MIARNTATVPDIIPVIPKIVGRRPNGIRNSVYIMIFTAVFKFFLHYLVKV